MINRFLIKPQLASITIVKIKSVPFCLKRVGRVHTVMSEVNWPFNTILKQTRDVLIFSIALSQPLLLWRNSAQVSTSYRNFLNHKGNGRQQSEKKEKREGIQVDPKKIIYSNFKMLGLFVCRSVFFARKRKREELSCSCDHGPGIDY